MIFRRVQQPRDRPTPAGRIAADVSIAPLDGAARAIVAEDASLRIPAFESEIDFCWSLRTASGWQDLSALATRQFLSGVATTATAVKADGHELRLDMAAGVSDGVPLGLIEFTNSSPVPCALGVRSSLHCSASDHGLSLEGRDVFRTELSARSAVVHAEGVDGEPSLVVPVPHGVTARFAVALERGRDLRNLDWSTVPTIEAIERGWLSHLSRGLRLHVDGDDWVNDSTAPILRQVLTSASEFLSADDIIGAAEFGFATPVHHLLEVVKASERSPAAVIASVASWGQLGEEATMRDEDALEGLVLAVAKAAHTIRRSSPPLDVPLSWGSRALVDLASDLRDIGQPDVASGISEMADVPDGLLRQPPPPSRADLHRLWRSLPDTMFWPPQADACPGWYLQGLRRLFVDASQADTIDLLPNLPFEWRGRPLEVHNAVLPGGGTLSFGIRWHGPRPALLWNVDSPIAERLRIESIDPEWETTDPSGEVLLPDPGWQTK